MGTAGTTCLFFVIYDEDEKANMTQIQRDFTMKNIIDRVEAAGLITKCFYSIQRDEIYVKVRCSPDRLKEGSISHWLQAFAR